MQGIRSMMNNFDEEFMEKKRPKIPVEYQPDPILRAAGVISPSRRMVYYNADFEFMWLKYLCYTRKLYRNGWNSLYRRIRIMKKKEKGALGY